MQMSKATKPCGLTLIILTASVCNGVDCQGAAPERLVNRPNILFIMVDDLGKEWVGCYGAEDIKTPHVDALAAGGMIFHNAY